MFSIMTSKDNDTKLFSIHVMVGSGEHVGTWPLCGAHCPAGRGQAGGRNTRLPGGQMDTLASQGQVVLQIQAHFLS